MSLTEKIRKSLLVSGLLSFLVFMSALTIYLGNLRDYTFTLQQLLVVAGAFSVGLWGGLFLLLVCFFRSKRFPAVLLAGLAFGLCLWVQGSFLLWPLGGDNTTIHSFGTHPVYGTLEILIFALIFWCVFHFKDFLNKNFYRIFFVVCTVQMIGLLPGLNHYDESQLNRLTYLRELFEGLQQYSSQENVLVIMLDSCSDENFQTNYALLEPEKQKAWKDFEHFPRLLSMYPQTFYALPTFLTGSDFFDRTKKWDVTKTVYDQCDSTDPFEGYHDFTYAMYEEPTSLLPNLEKAGFENALYPFADTSLYFPPESRWLVNNHFEEDAKEKRLFLSLRVLIEKILPYSVYRISPLLLKPVVFTGMDELQEAAYYLHSHESLTELASPKAGWGMDPLDVELAKDDRFFATLTQCNFKTERQFKLVHLNAFHALDQFPYKLDSEPFLRAGSLYFTQRLPKFFDVLRQNGIYDRSWIIIMGDHGMHSSPVSAQFNPLLLVKPPHVQQEKMKTNESVVLMRDIAPSLLSELGIRTAKPYSLWHQTEAQQKERDALWNEYIIKNSR